MKIEMTVELPDELASEFLNYLRAYEAPRTDKVHLNLVTTSKMTTEETNRMLAKIHPEIPWRREIPNSKA